MRNCKPILLIILFWFFAGRSLGAQQASPHLILLTDGSCLSGTIQAIQSGTIQIIPASYYGDSAESKNLSTSAVRTIVFTQPISIKERESLIRSAGQAPLDLDCIISNRGARQYGYLDKTDWFSIQFQKPDMSAGSFTVPMSETRAILLASRSETDTTTETTTEKRDNEKNYPVWLHLPGQDRIRGAVDESTWIRLRQDMNDQSTSSGKITVAVSWLPEPLSLPLASIESVEPIPSFAFPGFYWLSDLTAAQYKYIPFGTLKRPYFVDQAPDGSLLRAHSGALYRHGFFLYASCRLTFLLPKSTAPDAVLSGTIARPEGVRRGTVRFRAFYNGNPLGGWSQAASDAPQDFRISLPPSAEKNVQRRLDLVVDFADDDATDDQIILGNLRIEFSGNDRR